jgi:beta-galactosidase
MNVSINPYSNLNTAWYPYQLKKRRNPVWNVDHRVSGIGGTPITVRHAYRTYPDEYNYRIRFSPATSGLNKVMEMAREAW